MSDSDKLLPDRRSSQHNYGSVAHITSGDMEEHVGNSPNQEAVASPDVIHGKKRPRFRLFLIRTLCLYMAYICLGLNIGEGGSTFLDLLLLVRTDVEKGSVLYTASSVGYASGALLAGVLYDLLNWDGLLFLALFFMGGFNMAVVWCPTLWLMSLVNGLRGATFGSLDTGGNTVCVGMWKDEGSPYLQALHLSFSIGGVVAPFIVEPFLAPKSNETSQNVSQSEVGPSVVNSNWSTIDYYNLTDAGALPVTRVEYAYLIIGGWTTLASIPFLILFSRQCNCKRVIAPETEEADDTKDAKQQSSDIELSLGLRIVMLIFLGFFYAFYVSLEAFIEGYLMTFVVEYLDWSKTKGTRITSVFWGTFAAGRVLGVFISKVLTPWKMLLCDLVLVNAVFVPLWFVSKEYDVIVWVCIPLSGVFMATIFPTGISWTDQRIMKVTGKVASVFVLSSTIGGIFNPMLLGYLFKEVSPMWFVYLLMIEGALCAIVFLVITAILELASRKSVSLNTSPDSIQ